MKVKIDTVKKTVEVLEQVNIKELNEFVVQKLLSINGIGLSTATKILHTLYPRIIPMIDSLLQNKYRELVDDEWREKQSVQIFIDFYKKNGGHNMLWSAFLFSF